MATDNEGPTRRVYLPPGGGVVVGWIADLLRLRQAVPDGLLSPSDSTTNLYFRGEDPATNKRLSQRSRDERDAAVGRALLSTGLIPRLDLGEGLDADRTLMLAVWHIARFADLVAGELRETAPRVADAQLACLPYARLAIVDLSVRAAGFRLLTGWTPEPAVGAPSWSTERGGGALLRLWTEDGGPCHMSRQELVTAISEEIIDGSGIEESSVVKWLTGLERPTRAHTMAIARAVAARGVGTPEDCFRHLEWDWALWEAARRLAALVGWTEVQDLGAAAIRLTRRLVVSVRSSLTKAHERTSWAVAHIICGTEDVSRPAADLTLRALLDGEESPDWRTAIKAAFGDWLVWLGVSAGQAAGFHAEVESVMKTDHVSRPEAERLVRAVHLGFLRIPERMSSAERRGSGTDVHPGVAAWAAFTQAEMARLAGRTDDSIRLAQKATALRPDFVDAWLVLGRALKDADRTKEAIDALWMAAKLEPNCDQPRVEIACSLLRVGRATEAVAELERAQRELPAVSAWFHRIHALALANAQRVDEARIVVEKAIEMNPEDGLTLELGASLHFHPGGSRRKALRYAREARRLGRPEMIAAWEAGQFGGPPRRRQAKPR